MTSAVVLGAGMIGVSTALHLQKRGWSVVLVDRNEPGRETSYGNAGIIQSEALRPYAMPLAWREVLRIATGRTNDLRYHLASLPEHAGPLIRYWRHSLPSAHARASSAYAALVRRAVDEHAPLIMESGAGNLVRRNGFRVLHRKQSSLDAEVAAAAALHEVHGVQYAVLTARQLKLAEPGLNEAGVGGLHWTQPWTVSNPGALVTAYADLFKRLGGSFARGDANKLRQLRNGWSVATASGEIAAEHAVVALGPWSPDVLQPFGYRLSMVRKRGYHRHYIGGNPLDLPLRDAERGYVMAPMQDGIRITTGVELASRDGKADLAQLLRAERAARMLVDLGSPVESQPWFGTRPCMPDMLPVLGRAPRHAGLWLNFGHGHQGFTLGPITGRMVAELMSGERPVVDPFPYRPDRL